MKYLKRILVLIIGAILLTNLSFASNSIKIKVNGKYLNPDTSPFIVNSSTYVPIRFISESLNIKDITWNSDTNSVIIKNKDKKIALFINKNYAYINDEYVKLENNALIANSRTFVPIRFIAECFDTNVDWKDNTVIISSKRNNSSGNNLTGNSSENTQANTNSSNTSSSGNSSSSNSSNNNSSGSTINTFPSKDNSSLFTDYNDAVYWLSRIIEAEAGGEPFKGKVAVAEVILNRVKSDEFPDTIWAVIFDDEFGIQFEPVANGTIYNTPSDESIKAAKTALSGSNYVGNCLYFLNPTIAESNWITKNRDYYTTIANHEFYA